MENERTTLTNEERETQSRAFGGGITVAAGFDLGAKTPLDSRIIVATIEERDAHVTGNRAYQGMIVFVEADKKFYKFVDNTWTEFGFNAADLQDQIVNDLTTGGADKALSAEQGKVLKAAVDTAQGEVDALETKQAKDLETVNTALAEKATTEALTTGLAEKADKHGNLQQDFNTKNITVAGNLTVQGTTTSVETVNMEVKDNEITINKGETGAGVSGGVAGIRVERGSETDYLFHYDEEEDMFKVGMEGDLETVATRPYVNQQIATVNTSIGEKADTTALTAEAERAKGEEAKIRKEFADADTALDGKITTNAEAIAAEVTRATGVEQGLRTDVNAKVATANVVNDLVTTAEGKVLDARQGKVLDEKITTAVGSVTTLTSTVEAHGEALDTVDSRISTAKTEAIKGAKEYTDTALKGVATKDHAHEITQVTGLTEKIASIDGSITSLQGADSSMGEKITALEGATSDLGEMRSNITKNAGAIAKETTDRTEADVALGKRIDGVVEDVSKKATTEALTTGLGTKVNTSDLMVDGKIKADLIPSLAITETHVVANEEAMLKLTAQTGDIAIRTDLNKSFILKTGPATVKENWIELLTPSGEVSSVNGMKGEVTLTKSHVGLGNVTNESKETMFENPTFTGTVTATTAGTDDNSTKVATTAYVKAQGYLTSASTIDGGTF